MGNRSKLDWIVRIGDPDDFRTGPSVQFDDEGPWVQMLGFGWANIDTQSISVRPRKGQILGREPFEHATAQWSMAIHLLGLGLGWNDIRLGLQRWREEGYALGAHSILDFLWVNFAEDIEALEIYFGVMPRQEVIEALQRIRSGKNANAIVIKPAASLQREYEIRRDNWLGRRGHSAKSVADLLLHGNDPLHLEEHCSKSFVEEGWDLMGSQMRKNYGGLVSIVTPYYKGWAHRLAMFNDQFKAPNGEFGEVEIDVYVPGIGSLGMFVWNAQTDRWWRTSRASMRYRQEEDAHLWGHRH
jgi:hypothetical protein